MEGNPHYTNARNLLVRAEHASGPELADAMDRAAHTEATLALAWEQRTANLISCSQKVYVRDSPEQIRKRLGEGVGTPTPEPTSDHQRERVALSLAYALSPVCYTNTHNAEGGLTGHGDPTEYGVDGTLDLRETATRFMDKLAELNGG